MKKIIVFVIAPLLLSFSSSAQERREFNIYFSTNDFRINPRSAALLDSMAPLFKTQHAYTIQIEGYTDQTGSDEYNRILSSERANAVSRYLSARGMDNKSVSAAGNGKYNVREMLPDSLQRTVHISILILKDGNGKLGSGPYSFFGPLGTEVVSPSGDPIDVQEFFSPSGMLKGNMNAIAVDGSILQTAGMVCLCRDAAIPDSTGKFYIVKIPNRGMRGDTTYDVWLGVTDSLKETRWKLTTLKLINDEENGVFITRIPIEGPPCITINLDKFPNMNLGRPPVVYVSFYKSFKLADLSVSNENNQLSFSARVSDSLYAFVRTNNADIESMSFKGFTKDSAFTLQMKDALYSVNGRRDEHYYFCYDCINKKAPPVITPKKKKRGFFQWVADIFR